ncbi:peroxidase family protein [Poseidonocella sp. HB161398]|uniref:peroxidase family protein n=1 Tax=Poseidonocella sp. HB161398 TaxID=2320855 RepID=UPI001485E880|nr:peroxidase family protein [Poseidonocella sp. HB161398]
MSIHGRTTRACPYAALASGSGTAARKSSAHFRNLPGGTGQWDEISGFAGRGAKETAEVLGKLASRMLEAAPGLDPFNPNLPAGYTYLGQFAAHDMVLSDVSVSEDGRPGVLKDFRNERLLLETVYGGGPNVSPEAYAEEAYFDRPQYRLRLGLVRHGKFRGAGDARDRSDWVMRDIARCCPVDTNDAVGFPNQATHRRTPLVADPRNDDNFIISQLLVLFSIAHNELCEELIARRPALWRGQRGGAARRDRHGVFWMVRKMLARTWRRILIEDYLARLLDPGVYALYRHAGWRCAFSPPGDRRMPFEFSHGAFRMGHAMVRPRYELNGLEGGSFDMERVVARSSTRNPGAFPTDASWLVEWSRFFGGAQTPPQSSRKLVPHMARVLSEAVIDETLPYRDLEAAMAVGTRSARSLSRQFQAEFPGLAPALPEGAGPGAHGHETAIADWLRAGKTKFGDDEVQALAEDPPLPFFVLFEAMQAADGLRLGPVGSMIVAETMAGALEESRVHVRPDRACQALEKALGLDGVSDMPGFLRFVQALVAQDPALAKTYGLPVVPFTQHPTQE